MHSLNLNFVTICKSAFVPTISQIGLINIVVFSCSFFFTNAKVNMLEMLIRNLHNKHGFQFLSYAHGDFNMNFFYSLLKID